MPSTTVIDSNVIIAWSAPESNGSPINAYIIELRDHDGEYHLQTTYCDGSSSAVRLATSCTIPLSVLIAEPFNMALGDHIFAKITAVNLYGVSLESVPGDGAAMV